MQSLVVTVQGKRSSFSSTFVILSYYLGLKWGADDSDDAMLGRALTYLVLYSTFGMMVSLYF